ncbi:MAG: TonB-dependent receptor [Pseudomonadota bacterium]
MTLRETLKYSIMTSVAMSMFAGSASAQGDEGMDVVTVTAQKREQSIQDVPIAISAFDMEALQELGATSLEDVSYFIPGVALFDDRGAGQPTWIIRGVGLADFNQNNTPTAAIFYDEAYLVSNALGAVGLFDLERVEVLKGPQGGLYGRNTTGGAVRILSNRPDLDDYEGYAQGSYGRWGRYSVEGAVSIPLIEDKLAIRVSATTEQGGGWQDSLATPEDDEHGDRDFWAFRGQALYQPTPELEILFKADVGADSSETVLGRANATIDPENPFNAFGTVNFCAPITAGQRNDASCLLLSNLLGSPLLATDQSENGSVVLSNPINRLDNEWVGYNLNAKYDLGFATLQSISSYINFDYVQFFDFDGEPLELVSSAPGRPESDSTIEQWSQEVRLISSGDGPFTWLVGALYAEDTIDQVGFTSLADAEALFELSGVENEFEQKTESWALYGQVGYDLTDTININGSLRYTDEDKDIDYSLLGEATGFGSFPLLDPDGVQFSQELDANWSGHAGIDWRVADWALAYAKYSRGFKSGGFFGGFVGSGEELSPYEEETNDAFEIGLKSNPTDDLQVNVSGYFYSYNDVQGFAFIPSELLGTVTRLINLGDAEHFGVEVDTLWTPSQIPGFSLQLAGSWLDAEITDSDQISVSQDLQPIPIEGLDRVFAPQYSVTLNAQQEVDITNEIKGSLSLAYTWRDELASRETQLNDTEFGIFGQDSFGLLNLRLALANLEQGWEVSVLGENVTDSIYTNRATTSDAFSYMDLLGRPASWTVNLRYDF